MACLLPRHHLVEGYRHMRMRLDSSPVTLHTAYKARRQANDIPSSAPHTATLPLPDILHHNSSIPYTSIPTHLRAMRISALSLALLAVTLSGSANGKLDGAYNAREAFPQDTLAPSPTMDLIRRQIISSMPSPAPDAPVLSESPLAFFSLSSRHAFGVRARPPAAFWSCQCRRRQDLLFLFFFWCRSSFGADTRWGPCQQTRTVTKSARPNVSRNLRTPLNVRCPAITTVKRAVRVQERVSATRRGRSRCWGGAPRRPQRRTRRPEGRLDVAATGDL